MPTLSFGENARTCYGTESAITCWQVVSDESANPGFDSTDVPHEWVKLDHNHREVCKPRDESDPRYKRVADFIAEATKGVAAAKRPEVAPVAAAGTAPRVTPVVSPQTPL